MPTSRERRVPSGTVAIMGFLLLVPALFVAALQYKSTSEQVEFNRKELLGTEYMRPLDAFYHATLKHRVIYSAIRSGVPNLEGQLRDTLIEADTALRAVDALDSAHGGPSQLRTTPQWENVKKIWFKAKSQDTTTPSADIDDSAVLDNAIATLIRDYVGNYSNVILDPDVDSYWLMEALIVTLPSLSDTIARSHQLATSLVLEEHWLDRQGFELAGYVTATQTSMAGLEGVNFRQAFDHARETTGDQRLQRALEGPLSSLSAASSAYVALMRNLYLSRDAATTSLSALVEQTLATLRASSKVSQAVNTEVSRIITRRVDRYQARQTYGVAGSILTIVLLSGLYATFYGAVRRSVTNLARAHDRNAALLKELEEKHQALAKEKELRERFVSLLAHDLRGPLSVSRMGAGLLLEKKASGQDDTGSLLRMVVSSIDRTDQMIRDLLDAHRADSGEPFSLKLEKTDMSAIVQRVVEDLKLVHGDRFAIRPAPSPVVGRWDPNYVQRALWNLMSNAVKYGAPKTPITATITRAEQKVKIDIHNEGEPIPEEDLPNIFKPFARANSSREGSVGWGLGLTFVRGCAEGHGGTVRVRSSASEGTIFTFELPLDPHPDERANAETQPPPEVTRRDS